MPLIKLQSSDGELFEVDVELAKTSGIRAMLDLDLDGQLDDQQEVVHLPNVNAALLRKVIQWSTSQQSRSEDRSSPPTTPLAQTRPTSKLPQASRLPTPSVSTQLLAEDLKTPLSKQASPVQPQIVEVPRSAADLIGSPGGSFNPSPEILFLVREHAKTVSAISNISKRLDQLEVRVCDIQKSVCHNKSSSSSAAITDPKASSSCVAAHVLSDDSGGEYSRTTNGTNTDEDELLSLLDQLAKCSQQIRDTQQAQQSQQYGLLNSLTRDAPHHATASVTTNPVAGFYEQNSVAQSLLLGSTRQLTVPSVSGRDFQLHPVHLPAPPLAASSAHNSTMPSPLHRPNQRNQSSLSALLDPNVDRFLNNLQQELLTEPHDGRGPAPPTTSGYSHHYGSPGPLTSTPLHQMSSRELLMQSATASASSVSSVAGSNWRMERVRQLVRQREQEEAESQYDMADQWLASHLKKSSPALQRHHPHQ